MRTIGELVRGVVARCAEAMIHAGVEAAAAEDDANELIVRWLCEFREGLRAPAAVPVGYRVYPGAEGLTFVQASHWDFVSTPESVAAEIKREGSGK